MLSSGCILALAVTVAATLTQIMLCRLAFPVIVTDDAGDVVPVNPAERAYRRDAHVWD